MPLSIDSTTSMDSVADLTALKAKSVPPVADLCWVEGTGLYRYAGAATGNEEPFVVKPGSDPAQGRWLLDAMSVSTADDEARLARWRTGTDTARLTAWAAQTRTLARATGDAVTLVYDHLTMGSLDLSGVDSLDPAGLEIRAATSDAEGGNFLASIGSGAELPTTFYDLDDDVLPGTDRLVSSGLLAAHPGIQRGDLIVVRRNATRGIRPIGEMNAVKGVRDGIIYCEHPWLYDGIYTATGVQTQVGGYPRVDGAGVALLTPRRVSFAGPLTLSFDRSPFDLQGSSASDKKIPVGMDVWLPAWSEIKVRAQGTTGSGVRVYGGYGTQVELWGAGCTSRSLDDGTIGVVTGGRNVRVYLHAGAGRHVVGSGGHEKLGMAIWRFGGEAQGGRSNAALDAHGSVMELLVEPGTIFSGGTIQDPNAADGHTFRPGGASVGAYRWRAPHLVGRQLSAVVSLRDEEYIHLLEIGAMDLDDCDHGYRQNQETPGPVVHLARIGRIQGSLRSTWVPATQTEPARWNVGHAVSLLKDGFHRLEVGDVDVTGGAALFVSSAVVVPSGTHLRMGRLRCRRLNRLPAADRNTDANDNTRSPSAASRMLFAIRNINPDVTGLTAESFAAEGYDAALMVGSAMTHVEFGRVELRNNFTNGFITANIGTVVLGAGEIAAPTQTAAAYGFFECDASTGGIEIVALYLSPELRFTGEHKYVFGRDGYVGTIVGTPARLPAAFSGFGSLSGFGVEGDTTEIWIRTGALTSPGEVWVWQNPSTHPDANHTLLNFPDGTRVTNRTTGTSYVKSSGTWTAV
jgi:hypothetical protein